RAAALAWLAGLRSTLLAGRSLLPLLALLLALPLLAGLSLLGLLLALALPLLILLALLPLLARLSPSILLALLLPTPRRHRLLEWLPQPLDPAQRAIEFLFAALLPVLSQPPRFAHAITELAERPRHRLFPLRGVKPHAALQQVGGEAQAAGKLGLLR